jgi:membrane-bound metal-dependent hydrolase YbcI (DUF457 family)
MPYSHSVATAFGAALVAWLAIEKGIRRAALGRAVGLGIISHLILDLMTHGHDIVLWPGRASPKLGLGLYDAAPLAAFVVEIVYGVFCWRVYRGGRGLLALMVVGNLANLSFLSPAVPGPEQYLAGRPLLAVTIIFAQIVVTLVLVGVLARRTRAPFIGPVMSTASGILTPGLNVLGYQGSRVTCADTASHVPFRLAHTSVYRPDPGRPSAAVYVVRA